MISAMFRLSSAVRVCWKTVPDRLFRESTRAYSWATGDKEERLAALMDAIAEVYASIFGPDPTEYRAERGLLDVHEEMGIMIQEVVGQSVGKYFLPACSGVAFSNNEFRWSAASSAKMASYARTWAGNSCCRSRRRRLPGADRSGPAEFACQRHRRRSAQVFAQAH